MRDYNEHNSRQAAAEADLFDLALIGHAILFVFRAVVRHPVLAISAFLVVLASAVGGMLVYPQRYEISTTILAGSPLTGALVGDLSPDRDAPTRAARELLLRRENLEALVRDAKFAEQYLAKRPQALVVFHTLIDTIQGKERDLESVSEGLADTLEDRLWINALGDTVSITFRWWDAGIAYDVVEAAAASFLQMRRMTEINTVGESIAILEQHKATLEEEIDRRLTVLEEEEKTAGRKSTPAPALRPIRRGAAPDPELIRLEAILAASQRSAAELEAIRQQRVAEHQTQLLQQQTVYAPDHPTIAATQRMLETLQKAPPRLAELRAEARQLEAEIERRRGTVRPGLAASPAQSQDDPLRLLMETDPRAAYELDEIRTLRTQVADLHYRIATSRLHRETSEAAFLRRYSVITPPRLPKGPAKPYVPLFLIGGLLGGVLIALLAAVVADLRRGTVLERWQIEHSLGIPIVWEGRR